MSKRTELRVLRFLKMVEMAKSITNSWPATHVVLCIKTGGFPHRWVCSLLLIRDSA